MASPSQQNRTRIKATALAVRQYNRKYYAKNRDRILAQRREYKRRKRTAASDPELPAVASEPVDTEFYWEPKKETRGWLNWLDTKST